MGIKIKLRKKVTTMDDDVELDEVMVSQVSRYWPNKSHVLSYLRGRCLPDNPTACYLKRILALRD